MWSRNLLRNLYEKVNILTKTSGQFGVELAMQKSTILEEGRLGEL
jgi:hypothetical protein